MCGDRKDNVGEAESNPMSIGRMFGYQEEAYTAYNSYALLKGFGVRKSKIAKSRTDKKVIRMRFVCNKEGHKILDKRQEG